MSSTKRSAVDDLLPSLKRKKLLDAADYSFFDDLAFHRKTDDLTPSAEESGYLEAEVLVNSPPTDRLRIIFNSVCFGKRSRFVCYFSGPCLELFTGSWFSPGDKFKLALKGAGVRIVDQTGSSSKRYELEYQDGVVIKVLQRKGDSTANGVVYDTWAIEEEKRLKELTGDDHWFCTPQDAERQRSPSPPPRPSQNIRRALEIPADDPPTMTPPTPPPSSPLAPSAHPLCSGAYRGHLSTTSTTVEQIQSAPSNTSSRKHHPIAQPPSPVVPSIQPPTFTIASQVHKSSTVSSVPSAPVIVPALALHSQRLSPAQQSTSHSNFNGNQSIAYSPAQGSESHNASSSGIDYIASKEQNPPHVNIPNIPSAQQPFNQVPPQSGRQSVDKLSRKQRKKIERDLMRTAKKKAAKNGTGAPHHNAVHEDLETKPSVSEPVVNHVQHIQQNHALPTYADATNTHSAQPVPLPVHVLQEPPRRQSVQPASSEVVNLWESGQQQDVADSMFTPINNIRDKSSDVRIIGVVNDFTPANCPPGRDWKMTMEIKDSTGSIRVNCFTEKYREWLPDVKLDEIIILCGLKGQSWNGRMTAVGYKNRLQWLVYNPMTGKFRSKPSNPKIPDKEFMEKREHTPFLNYDDFPDIAKDCLAMWEWFKADRDGVYRAPALNASRSNLAVKEESKPPVVSNVESTVYYLGEPPGISNQSTASYHREEPSTYSSAPVRRRGRQHHLLSEATPETDPGGYFDCTVEICHGTYANYGAYILYVTDYTAPLNDDTSGKEWCPPRLKHLVLKIELTDAAAVDGHTMLKGEFYLLQNCRMKRGGSSGFVECVIREKKALKLEPETARSEHLRELLKRKHEFEGKTPFAHKLLSDVDGAGMYRFTVEVLRAGLDVAKRPFLVITDYTENPRLPTCDTLGPGGGGPRTKGLDHRILQVSLGNGQEDVVQTLEEGKLYSITNMRIRETPADKKMFYGVLSGKDILVNPVNTRRPSEEAKALEKRKLEWQNRDGGKADEQMDDDVPPPVFENKQPEASLLTTRKDCKSIKDAFAITKQSHIFKCIGKVVDSFPKNPREFTTKWCANCGKDIKVRACISCNDMSHKFVKWKFRFTLDVVDEDGTRMTLVVSNSKSSENPVLKDCEAKDLQSTEFAYFKLRSRIRQLIGDASEAFDSDFSNGDYSSSMVYHVVASMEEVGDSYERVYFLVGFEDL